MFDLDTMERRYRQMRRATVARSALDVIAMIFLGAGFAFWGVAFWQLLTPPAILSLLTIQAAVLALAFSLAAPLLISMLVPTTPAGQLLQKTQWATVGFYVILGAAIFLLFQAEQLIETWLYAQQAIREVGWERRLAIVLVIAFVIIPALAWVQLTPERWAQQIQQAHQVKKVELQQRGELATIKASLLRAELLAERGWANLLPEERIEAIATRRGLTMAISDTQRSIVRTLGLSAELERSVMGDQEIAEYYDSMARALDVSPQPAALPADGATTVLAPQHASGASERANHAPVPYTEPHQVRDTSRVAVRQDNAGRDDAYTLAYDQLSGGAWTVRELAELLDVAESTARDIRIRWTAAGLVSGRGLPNGRYSFTERRGA